ncbi:MAG: hypothetical protein ABEH83_14025 [Halobacterium sp.]
MPADSTRRNRYADGAAPPPEAYERTDAVYVEHPVRDGAADAVEALVASERPNGAADAAWLVDGGDVATVTLFLRNGDDGAALGWYVEVTTDAWDGPDAELRERSPLFDAGLAAHLDETARRRVNASEQAVHVCNPARPGTPDDPDVVLVRLGVHSGVPAAIARGLVAGIDLLEDTWLHRRLVAASGDVIEDERMWTETLWLERTRGDYAVRWYMEADDLEHVNEAYEESDNRVARWSDAVLSRVFEEPVQALGDPLAASDWTVLAHATDPANR